MHFPSVLYVTLALAGLFAQAAPISERTDLDIDHQARAVEARETLAHGSVLGRAEKRKAAKTAAKPAAKPAAPKVSVPKVVAPPKVATPSKAAPVAAKVSPTKVATPVTALPPAKTSSPVKTSAAVKTSSVAKTSSATAAPTTVAAACPVYNSADKQDISERDFEVLAARAGEEFWFRWEDPNVAKGGTVLTLAPRAGTKDFDDQAYKWISTNAAAVTRGSFAGRVATIYVLPSGTAQQLLAQAKDFETTSAAGVPADFVTKDNEPGDLGINGVAKSADGTLPLDVFRSKIIRTVVKTSNKGSQQFTTVNKAGKASKTASKADQALLNKIAC